MSSILIWLLLLLIAFGAGMVVMFLIMRNNLKKATALNEALKAAKEILKQ